jgi:uncharacterized protein (DUF3084 family)
MDSYTINYGKKLEDLANAKNSIEKAEQGYIIEINEKNKLKENLVNLTKKMNNTLEKLNNTDDENLRLTDDKTNALEEINKLEKDNELFNNKNEELSIEKKKIEQDNIVLNDKLIKLSSRIKELENRQIDIIESGQALHNLKNEVDSKPLSLIEKLKQEKKNLLKKFPFFKEKTNIEYNVNNKWYSAKIKKHQYNKKKSKMEIVIKLPNGKESIVPYSNLYKSSKLYRGKPFFR